jgi:hypothetical protein
MSELRDTRLRDSARTAGDASGRAARLLASEEPLAPSPESKQRVRDAVFGDTGGGAARSIPGNRVAITLIVAAVVVIGFVWLALRSVSRSETTETRDIAATVRQVQPPLPQAVAVPAIHQPVAPAPVSAPMPRNPEPKAARSRDSHIAPSSHVIAPTATGEVARTAQQIDSPAAAPVPDDPGAALMVAAVRALEHDHDPVRAGRLVEDYLSRYPDGQLVEEALYLGFKAAKAREDDTAAGMSERYLARFPHGRYRDAVLGIPH